MSLDIYLECDVVTGASPSSTVVYSANYTHNVTPMWHRAGVYDALYMSAGKKAGEIAATLWSGVARMTDDQPGYEALNPPNGWGDYESALVWLRGLAEACREYPAATISVWK